MISCGSNVTLADSISKEIGVTLTSLRIDRFQDTEISIGIDDDVRGDDVFVIQSTSRPVNYNVMELLICVDMLKRASAKSVNVVIPYFGYARQDSCNGYKRSAAASLIASMIVHAGASRILTMDLHTERLVDCFSVPVEHLQAASLFACDIKNCFSEDDVVVVSPDIGGVERAKAVAKMIGAELVIMNKHRDALGKPSVVNIIGDIQKKKCIIVDDIIDSADTLCGTVEALRNNGSREVYAYVSHGVLSGEALQKIEKIELEELVITDSIPITRKLRVTNKIRILSVASLFADSIKKRVDKELVLDSGLIY